MGSREEWRQESIDLKEVCLYVNFEVCLHVIGNDPAKKENMIMQEEIKKVAKQKSYRNGLGKWVSSPMKVLTLDRSQDSFSIGIGGGVGRVFWFWCRYNKGLVDGKMK